MKLFKNNLLKKRIGKTCKRKYFSLQILKYTQKHLYQSCTPLLRSFLHIALNDLPHSTLLSEYLELEKASHVVTRARQFFTSHLTVDSSSGAKAKELLAIHSVLFEFEQLEKLLPTGTSITSLHQLF